MRGRLLLLSGPAGVGGQTIALGLLDGGQVLGPDVYVDQAVGLPLIDGGEVLGPTLDSPGTITLPVIDGGQIFGPDVIPDQAIELPLIDGGVVYGPTVTVAGDLELPLIDGGSIFGPTVVVEQQADLPLIDGGEVFGPSVVRQQVLTVPLLDGGWVFAPAVLGTITPGLVTAAGATEVGNAFDRSFRDENSGTGSFRMALQNGDAALASLGFDDLVVFSLAGQERFAGVIENRRIVTHASGEEHDQITTLSGRGRGAILDRSTIGPARGLGSYPIEITRSFSWPSFDFDDTEWPMSKRTLSPSHGRPEWWPDAAAWWVWADRDDVTPSSAPGGRCLTRQTFTLAADARLRIFAGLDNFGTGYFDGVKVIDTENDSASFIFGEYVEIPEVSAGEHVLAFSCLNTGRHGGVIYSVWTVDEEGLLDEVVARSDSTVTKCLPYPYPNNMPGFTAGEALRLVVEEGIAEGELPADMALDFTDELDSDGEPWTEVAEITVDIGRSVLELVEALSDWLIDWQMAPGSNTLRAWNWGTRGVTRSTGIVATSDPDTSEIEAMVHDGRHVRANRLLIRYRGGLTEVVDQDSIDDHDKRSVYVDLGHVESETAAKRIGAKLLELRKDPTYATNASLAPVTCSPYEDFDNGDTLPHPSESGGTTSSRVRAIEIVEDVDGDITPRVDLRDIRREAEERYDLWLKRMAAGALAGGARAVSRSGEALTSSTRIAVSSVAEFSFQDPVSGATTGKRPADTSGNLIELYVEVSTNSEAASVSATVVRVYRNGVSIGDVTVAAGDTANDLDLSAIKTRRNTDKYRAQVVSVGGDVVGVDVQVRAI